MNTTISNTKTKTEETKPCDDCSRPSVQCCGLTDEDDKEIWKCEGCCCGEEEYVCCGCGCEMADRVDYGNNADVGDTCCELCFAVFLATDGGAELFTCDKCMKNFMSGDGEECPHCGYCPRLDGAD